MRKEKYQIIDLRVSLLGSTPALSLPGTVVGSEYESTKLVLVRESSGDLGSVCYLGKNRILANTKSLC